MILPKIVLPELVNHTCHTTGVDSYNHCFDKAHFESYPYNISYQYNDRGFRDCNWPNNLQDSIWCIGDSFTVGLGTPFDKTWTQVLKQITNIATINIAMDGASNQWIARKAIDILNEVSPKIMVLMWSYAHRRESDNSTITDLQRRMHYKEYDTATEDFLTFKRCVHSVIKRNRKTKLIHLTVPKALDSELLSQVFKNVDNYLGEVTPIDLARDSWHFDYQTSQNIANQIRGTLLT